MPLRLCLLAALSLLASPAASALTPETMLAQAQHTTWGLRDGSPNNISDIAQTPDGFLWLATTLGLYEFDGKTFTRHDLLPSTAVDVVTLAPMPGNTLWVGTRRDGILTLHNGRVDHHYGPANGLPLSTIYSIHRTEDGAVWAAGAAGVFTLHGEQWQRIWPAAGQPTQPAANLLLDSLGTLCFTTYGSVLCKRAQETAFTPQYTGPVEDLAVSPQGDFWLWISGAGAVPLARATLPVTLRIDIPHGHMIFTRTGDLVVVTYGHGLTRYSIPTTNSTSWTAETYARKDGLASDFLHSAFQDREGNLWFGTTKGLERFRASKLVSVPAIGDSPSTVLLPGDGNQVWAGLRLIPLQHITSGNTLSPVPDAPTDVTCAYADPDGSRWFGASNALHHFAAGKHTTLRLPDNIQGTGNDIQAITRDSTGTLWASVVSVGVLRYSHGAWSRFEHPSGHATDYATALFTDGAGRVWLTYHDRTLLVDGATITRLAPTGFGDILSFAGHGSHVWVGAQHGLGFFHDGRFQQLRTTHDDQLRGISGIVLARDGSLWVHALAAVLHLAPEELLAAEADSAKPIRVESYSFSDGLPGEAPQIRPFPSAIEAADGRIWFSTTSGVVWLDPAHLPTDRIPPPLVIRSLEADGHTYTPDAGLKLPARIHTLAIQYASPSLSKADGTHFRYKLEGFDPDWQEGGEAHLATFTGLPPGHYRFHVIAANADDVWNTQGASIALEILPAFYQTTTFRILCWLSALLLLFLLYHLRLRMVTERLRNLLAERLAERERIARELHDTLLQGVQGLILLFQGIAFQLPVDSPLASRMDAALDRAERLMTEGRDSVRDLRSPAFDLGDALGSLHDLNHSETAYTATVAGQPQELQLLICDEVYKIAREAVLNAFQHARASHLDVTLSYHPYSLVLTIRDDGTGMPADILREGRPGHWGLTGMRDRARRLKGTLDVRSEPGSGTSITLTVPASIAYRKPPLLGISLFHRLQNIFRSQP